MMVELSRHLSDDAGRGKMDNYPALAIPLVDA